MANPFDYKALYEVEEKTIYPRSGSPRVGGFGLTDLVVVAAILALTAAILYPVFMETGGGCGRANSPSNVKQLSLGSIMYAADYDDHLPPAKAWMDATAAYVQNPQIYIDPDLKDPQPRQHGIAFFKPLSGVHVPDVVGPETTPLTFQSMLLRNNATSDLTTLPSPPRNEKGNAVAFADCHAKRMPKTWPETPIVLVIDHSQKKEGIGK